MIRICSAICLMGVMNARLYNAIEVFQPKKIIFRVTVIAWVSVLVKSRFVIVKRIAWSGRKET